MSADTATARRSVVRPSRAASWRSAAPAIALMAWGGNHFTPLLLLYRAAEGYSALQVDLLLAFYIVGLVPGFLLAGPLSDRHGRKPLIVVGLALGILGSVVLGVGAGTILWLCVGRLVSGVSVAIAMVVGTSWIKELSSAPFDGRADAASGARRASLTLTAGFGVGAGVSGVLGQWGPAPTLLPYAVQVALSLVAAVVLTRTPETRAFDGRVRSLLADLRIPRAGRRRFLGIVLPMAPWVFAAAALSYAISPTLVAGRVGSDGIAFATLLTVVTLGCGAGIQPFAPRLGRWTGGRQVLVGLGLALLGAGLCALEAALVSPVLALVVGAVLGMSYGICLVSGLIEVQRMSGPDDLAGVTGVYYSLTYVGFLLPVVLAALTSVASYAVLLLAVTAVCLGCGLTVARNLHRLGALG